MARKTKRYLWQEGDFTISAGVDLPPMLEAIVKKAPSDDQAKARYFKELLSANQITADDMTFLLESGVLTS